MTLQNDIARLRELRERLDWLLDAGHSRTLRRAVECMEHIERSAPLQVGDRVALWRAPDLTNKPGWVPYRDALVTNAAGVVREQSLYPDGLRFGVVFDDIRPGDDLAFTFPADDLIKVDPC